MENLGTRPTEFVISRSPQMLQLSNQIIWLVAQRQDNLGGREDTVLSRKWLCSNNQDERSSCHCLSRCSQFGGSENKRRHGFDPTDLRRCNKPTIHSELELLRVHEFP